MSNSELTGPSTPRVTAVIAARNEAGQIADAIASAFTLCQRVIVVDDRSSDGTGLVAEQAGAEVVEVDALVSGNIELVFKQGFLSVCEGWILRMDADERLNSALATELLGVALSGDASAARYARLNVMFGDAVKHGGWFNAHQLGFFRSDRWDVDWDGAIHSQIPIEGVVVTIDPKSASMLHLDYDRVAEFVTRTLLRYATLEASELHARSARFTKRRILLDPFIRVWGRYFFRRGYRDGDRGLVLAGLLGAYDITRWSMLWEAEKDDHQRTS